MILIRASIVFGCLLSVGLSAGEVAIPIQNPSFETPLVIEPSKIVDGWVVKSAGAEVLPAGYKSTVVKTMDGKQFLRFGADGQGGVVEQQLATTVKPGAYTLQLDVNRVFNDSNMVRSLSVELLGGDVVLDSLMIAEDKVAHGSEIGGQDNKHTLVAYVAAGASSVGKPLVLRLTGGPKNGFGMVGVDRISLTYDADAKAAALYQLDVTTCEKRSTEPLPGMGGVAKDGTRYTVDGERWMRDGKPWYPVSGEFHYVRYPEAEWSRELAKMKALGVDIVATYVFWNHHENPMGTWNWQGQLNLRRFIECARENGLLVWLRVGPYINAETKNGGIPDFANKGKRSNSPDYLPLVETYYGAISEQVKGLFVQDGGPIVGIQLDNEFASGDAKHITKLKEIAISKGMTVPYWTVTANSRFERMTAIPLQGSYTYRGWEGGGGTNPTSGFSYSTDEWTANTDLGGTFYDTKDYPRGFCELGTGSPMNGGARFLVEPDFVVGQAWDCVGRGTNYLGYYMFHGGTQYPGMQSGSWPMTYDFQAPLGEFGQIRESGRQYRRLHTFVREFASELTVARAVRDPKQNPDPKQSSRLRHIGRFAGDRGFWFVNNTQRNLTLPTRSDVQVEVKLSTGKHLTIPSEPLVMPDRRSNVFPINMDLGGVDLLWATVQPLARLSQVGEISSTVFWMPDWTNRELCFTKEVAITVESGKADVRINNSNKIVQVKSAKDRVSLLVSSGQKKVRILLITDEDSRQAVVTNVGGVKRLVVLSRGDVTSILSGIKVQGEAGQSVAVEIYPSKGLRPSAQWKVLPVMDGWARFSRELPASLTSPNLTENGSGVWSVVADTKEMTSLSHAYLEIPYLGNEAQLLVGDRVLTNDYHHGVPWVIDLKRFSEEIANGKLKLKISGHNASLGNPRWLPQREVEF